MADSAALKDLIVHLAGQAGFVRVGIAPAGPSPRGRRYREFLARGYHAGMGYLARNASARCDPREVLPGARSVICLAASYAPGPAERSSGHIARYARGRDYHRLLRKRCRRLLQALVREVPGLRAKVCVDTSPLLERDLAAAAGLGWIGRNGCLVDARFGSYLLLAEIVTDLPLEPDRPVPNGCGDCRACVRACPAGAITPEGLVDSRRCVSYLTIEHRGEVPEELRSALGTNVFGCDLCQEVCPHNRGVGPGDADLRGPSDLARASLAEILGWDEAAWDRLTRGSAGRRARHEQYLRNAAIAAGNAADASLRAPLRRLARRAEPVVAEAARWALGRLGQSRAGGGGR